MAISVKDIHKPYEVLRTRGVELKSEPREKEGLWTVFFEEPERNLLHLIQRPKPV
jgi:hypothetical protein